MITASLVALTESPAKLATLVSQALQAAGGGRKNFRKQRSHAVWEAAVTVNQREDSPELLRDKGAKKW